MGFDVDREAGGNQDRTHSLRAMNAFLFAVSISKAQQPTAFFFGP